MAKTNPDIKWIKIATNVFSDEKIMLIEQMPEADTMIVIWFKLLCMAGKENNLGVFIMGGRIPYTDEMLSTIFRRPLATVRLALSTFEAFGMVEIIADQYGNDVYTIPNWEKHQNADGMDKIREQTRQRVAKHREKQRLAIGCNDDPAGNVTVTLPVTQCNATEKEKEEDKEEEKKKKKKKTKKPLSAPYVADDALNTAINDFIDFRNKIKKPMTEKAIQLMISKLYKLSTNVEEQIEIINQSILNGWQTIYPLKQNTIKQHGRQEVVPDWMKNKNSFNNFQQNQYNFDELEAGLLANDRCGLDPDFLKKQQEAEERIKSICGG
jgi:predicted phage replisome organizer